MTKERKESKGIFLDSPPVSEYGTRLALGMTKRKGG
jgi:hypothetical protein